MWIAVCVTGTLSLSAPSAFAEMAAPWWGLTTEARPTDLQEVKPKDEVQQLTVSATGGEVFLVGGGRFVLVPFDATAAQLQEAIEELYPSRKAVVTGGPGDEDGAKPYVITFPGQSVEPMFASGVAARFFGGKALSCEGATGSGCSAEAAIAEVEKGAPGANITVVAENLGDSGTNPGAPVSIADELPPGLEAVAIEGDFWNPLECSLKSLTCTFTGTLDPYEAIEAHVSVVLKPGASSGEQNVATVAGGGAAASKTASQPLQIGEGKRFGVEDYQLTPENIGGALDTQAGSHPFQLTSVVTLNREVNAAGYLAPVALPKDIVSELPTGLVGNPTPLAQCTDAEFEEEVELGGGRANRCPAQSAIGVANVTFQFLHGEPQTSVVPMFNMVPLNGEPARFGFAVEGIVPVFLDTSVRTGGDYGVTVSADNIIQIDNLLSVKLTFWGVPGDPRHDSERGWECLRGAGQCLESKSASPPPFLVMPTSCEQPYESTLRIDSWAAGVIPSYQSSPVTYRLPEALDGCNHLPFGASISAAPDVTSASAASGLTLRVHVPQQAELNPEGLAESTLRDTTVTLPAGVGLNPSGADGLQGCSESQIGFLAQQSRGDELRFTPEVPSCPDASKIGTVKIKTPLLPNPLEGVVYLATQGANPFGSLIAMYIVAEDPVSGVLVKLPGEVEPDLLTGQLVSSFKDTPQLPFEDLELHFFGGARAPLTTPAMCGSYTTEGSFAPWSGEAAFSTSAAFLITSGPNGGSCPGQSLPFGPALTAGATNVQAGAFSPFTMTMSRPDGSQNLDAIRLHMPPGLSGTLAGVELCGEPRADEGTCRPNSLIGETTISVGVGNEPFTVTGGRVYLTSGYDGAPYGLSIVNPAKAGPFDLEATPAKHPACDCLVVRAKIEVDPTTAALTVTSPATGPYRIPTMIEGIPLQIQHVNVTVNRPAFTFNPTSCAPMAITGDLTSAEGATDGLSVPFQVTNCARLAFKPQFTVGTSAHTSRTDGASLDVKLDYPNAPFGSQSNLAKVKVELPKQLPSRLTTLQKACVDTVFDANPANCPAASRVGEAMATTPILPVALSGPAYFVSHGGAKFPELIIVLSGYGTTVELHGETFIDKAGITSSTFNTVPDLPVSTFELKLPEKPDSALAANGDLCAQKMVMPTTFTAQDGTVIEQKTPIRVEGCSLEIVVLRHKVSGKTATVVVRVPSAGRLVAGGGGVLHAAKAIGKPGIVTLHLRLSRSEQRFVAHHHGRRLRVPIKLSFKPGRGKNLHAIVAVLMR